jgi:hypothetical protein
MHIEDVAFRRIFKAAELKDPLAAKMSHVFSWRKFLS